MIGFIYVITCKLNNFLYIGSTTRNLEIRMKQHKRDMTKYINFKLYKAMTEFEFDNFYINLVEEIEYNDVSELRKQEGKYIKLFKPILNTNVAGRTIKEYNEDNREELKLYRKLYYRKYRELHREHLTKYRIQYYKNKNKKV